MSHELPPCDHDECPPSHCKRTGSLAASDCSVVVRLEYAWHIQRKNSLDIVRHTLRSASEPSLNYHEQIIGELCEALSQAQARWNAMTLEEQQAHHAANMEAAARYFEENETSPSTGAIEKRNENYLQT